VLVAKVFKVVHLVRLEEEGGCEGVDGRVAKLGSESVKLAGVKDKFTRSW
jgi:hypothetical protein